MAFLPFSHGELLGTCSGPSHHLGSLGLHGDCMCGDLCSEHKHRTFRFWVNI